MMRLNNNLLKSLLFTVIVLFSMAVCMSASAQNTPEYREKDKKCMEECHGKLNLYYNPASPWGNMRSAKIDYDKFLNSKHGIFYCTECHEDADKAGEKTHYAKEVSIHCDSCHIDENQYSDNIKKLFASKQIRMDDKKRVAKDYYESTHGKAYLSKKRNAPFCTGCHDPHNANLADKDSTVSKANIVKTCGTCHQDVTFSGKNIFGKLAMLRINGHKKGNSSIDYSYNNCVGCHQGDAVHGKNKSEINCMSCHKKSSGFIFTDFHGKNIPVLAYIFNFGLVFGSIFVIGFAIFFFAGKTEEKKEVEHHEK